jgi:hypothetical protein
MARQTAADDGDGDGPAVECDASETLLDVTVGDRLKAILAEGIHREGAEYVTADLEVTGVEGPDPVEAWMSPFEAELVVQGSPVGEDPPGDIQIWRLWMKQTNGGVWKQPRIEGIYYGSGPEDAEQTNFIPTNHVAVAALTPAEELGGDE